MAQKGECPLGLLCEHSVDGSRDYSDQSQRAREGDCGTDQGSWDGSVIRAHQAVGAVPDNYCRKHGDRQDEEHSSRLGHCTAPSLAGRRRG